MADYAVAQGQTLGHYRIAAKIGSGGMGEVYCARDEHLDREVAIKVLPSGMLSDELSRKRFRKEALTLSKLNHPNIATIHDFDTQQGVDFLVMEYIPGITLSEKLAGGSLPEKEVVRLGIQLAEGLCAAHERGVVHRDLKPGNLRLTTDERLKILDFGLAKLRLPVTAGAVTESLSMTEAISGTLPYMAPEQLLGGEIDARTDIHAVGSVLYEMAAGQRPFADVETSQLIGAILHRTPQPASALNAKVSPELERIIGKCLEKEPENRYQSATELAVDLRRLSTGVSVRAAEPERSRALVGAAIAVAAPSLPTPTKWRARTAILAVCIGLLVVAALVLRRVAYLPYLPISSTRQLTFDGDLARLSAIETDGRRVFYFKFANSYLYLIPVNGGEERSYATKFVQPVILHISPDGSLLLVKELTARFGRYANRLWMVPTNGGQARPLGDIEAEFAAWSPDGKTIAFAQHNALYLTDDEGATSHRLVGTPGVPWWIRWSPDGQRLRFTLIDSTSSVASIWEVSRSGRTPPVEMELGGHSNLCCGIWTRDGRRFLFREDRERRGDYWVTDESWSTFRSRRPFLLSGGGVEMVAATASPLTNTLFVVGTQDGRMSFKFDVTHRQLTPFPAGLSVEDLNFSSDGKWMLMTQIHSGESILFRARSDGSEGQPLTDRNMQVLYGRFSRTGNALR